MGKPSRIRKMCSENHGVFSGHVERVTDIKPAKKEGHEDMCHLRVKRPPLEEQDDPRQRIFSFALFGSIAHAVHTNFEPGDPVIVMYSLGTYRRHKNALELTQPVGRMVYAVERKESFQRRRNLAKSGLAAPLDEMSDEEDVKVPDGEA